MNILSEFRGGAIAAGIALCALGLPLTAQAETTLQFNRFLPPTHFVQADVLDPWAEEIGKVTEGRVKVQMTATSLGPPVRQFDLVRDGVADVTWGIHGYTPERFPTSAGMELPFLGNSAEALSVAYWRAHRKHFSALKEHEGTKLLALHVHPPGDVFSNRPLRNLEDFRGQKLRIPNPAAARITDRLGAVAVQGPATKAYELLSRGIVDGTFLPADSIVNFKLQKLVSHHLQVDGGIYNVSFFVVMNQKRWDSLSKGDQAAIEKISGEEFAKRMGGLWDQKQAEALEILDKQGVVRTRVEGAMLEDMKARIGDAEADWTKSMAERGVDGAAALQMIRSEARAYEKTQ